MKKLKQELFDGRLHLNALKETMIISFRSFKFIVKTCTCDKR
jgi:hypothetical protein